MMDTPLDLKTMRQLFDLAVAIEHKAAAFYDSLSVRFSHVSDVAGFWREMAADEKEHAAILIKTRESLTAKALARSPDHRLARRVAEASHQVDGLTSAPIETLDDAYELAHDIEFSEVNAVFKVLATETVPAETHRRFVLDHIETHQKRLLAFSSGFGERSWRREISAKGALAL